MTDNNEMVVASTATQHYFFFPVLCYLQLLLWVLLSGISFTAFAGQLSAAPDHGVIVVSGTGSVDAVPDEVRFVVGIDAKAPTVQQAYREVEEKMQQAIGILHKLGVEKADVQAMNLSLNPIIDYKQRDRIIAHDARRDIAVKVDDIALYASAMQQLAAIEVTRFQQVQMSHSNRKQLELQALEKAYENARQKAKALATQAGQSLGHTVEVIEHGAQRVPLVRSGVMAMHAESNASSATVSSGMIRVQVQISATFAIDATD